MELIAKRLGQSIAGENEERESLEDAPVVTASGRIEDGMQHIRRLVVVDQKPIGRTPRSNLATYTGLFDQVRRLFASTPWPARDVMTPVVSRSMSRRVVAQPVLVKDSLLLSSCSYQAYTAHVQRVMGHASTRRLLKFGIEIRALPTCWQ